MDLMSILILAGVVLLVLRCAIWVRKRRALRRKTWEQFSE